MQKAPFNLFYLNAVGNVNGSLARHSLNGLIANMPAHADARIPTLLVSRTYRVDLFVVVVKNRCNDHVVGKVGNRALNRPDVVEENHVKIVPAQSRCQTQAAGSAPPSGL